MVGGTVKGTMLTASGDFSLVGMLLVVFYAALSALVAYLTKLGVDWMFSRMCRSMKMETKKKPDAEWTDDEENKKNAAEWTDDEEDESMGDDEDWKDDEEVWGACGGDWREGRRQ